MDTNIRKMKDATTWEELKKAYVDILSGKPDAETVEAVNTTFEELAPKLKTIHKTKDGVQYEKAPAETVEEFRELIETLIALEGVAVEVCGTWLWVSGNTKEHKEALKACGFRWSAKKKRWFKAPEGTRQYHYRNKKSWTMEQIRSAYGSRFVEDADEIA